jgi:hypothetical protein
MIANVPEVGGARTAATSAPHTTRHPSTDSRERAQGLPTTVMTQLTITAKRLRESNVFVKKLDIIETLGCATVICRWVAASAASPPLPSTPHGPSSALPQ